MGFDTTHEIRICKENLDIDSLKMEILNTVKALDGTLDSVRNSDKLLNITSNDNFYIIEETFNHWIFRTACRFLQILSKNIDAHIYLKSISETDVIGTSVIYNGDMLTSHIVQPTMEPPQCRILIKGKNMRIQEYTVENYNREKASETAIGIFRYHNPGVEIKTVWNRVIY